jgi:hypothetical protein
LEKLVPGFNKESRVVVIVVGVSSFSYMLNSFQVIIADKFIEGSNANAETIARYRKQYGGKAAKLWERSEIS